MFCSYCGNQIPDNSIYCPVCRAQLQRSVPAQQTVRKTPLAGLALGFGIAGAVFGYIGFIANAVSRNALPAILLVLAIFLGIAAVICGSIGLKRSIHTGGRKYVAGIVLSAVGISGGAVAHVFAFMGILVGSMISRF